eukprot:6707838-Pyramimonas_sp.AAC.1
MTRMCSALWTLPAARRTRASPRFRQPNCPPKDERQVGCPPSTTWRREAWAASCQNGARAQVA